MSIERDMERIATEAEKLRKRFNLTAQESLTYSLDVWRSNPHNTLRTVGSLVDHVVVNVCPSAPPVVE